MGLFGSDHRALRKDSKRSDKAVRLSEFGAIEIDDALIETLRDDLPDPESRPAIQVRPFKDNDGIESGRDFLQSVYEVERGGFRDRKNVSPSHSFEIRYTGERMNIQYVPDPDWTDTFESQLQDKYPNALIEQAPPETLSFDAGKYVAGAELDLSLYTLYPIKHLDLEGFRRDPFGSITSAIEDSKKDGEATADVLMQVVIRPESRDWVHGINGGPDIDTIAHSLKQPRHEKKRRLFTSTTVEHPPSDIEKQAAKIVRDQHGDRAWNVNIRIFAVSREERVARRRVKKAATQFENYYETATEQKFEPVPLKGSALRDGLDRLVKREWVDRGIVKSEAEVAGFVHVPNAEINQQNFDWALSKPGEGIPPGTPRFDFDEAGVAMASNEEKQLEMLDSSGPGDPFWFGWGAKNGLEAGIYEHTLNAHMFVGGGTRKGKSTLLTNFTSQVMERDYGGLVITLGKGGDDEEFIAEWPEDRPEEDFVFIDTGDDYEEMVRFNLLEVPDELEPGSVAHSSYVESLADDMSAAFAQTGGSDNYWGALMSRVTRTLIRGMTMSGKTCTPVDLAAACSSQDNLERFADWMDEERVHFIRETAERIKEKEDSDLEPLAGRMDNVVHNATLRTLLSTREPTIRIQDIVDDGKIAVLRLDPSLGETEKNFITTPLVRRFYNAKKMSENDDPYFVIWDEFDKAVTPESNVDEMLSEAGGYGLWFVLACQAPSYQLPEQLTDAVESQIETFVSFGTSGQDAKYIAGQHTIDADDLSNLSRYSMYMRTHDENDDFTHSYRVNTFPPVREVRSEVGDGQLMDDDEIAEFKRKSVERYGNIPETPEEIKAESHFFAGGSPADALQDESTQQAVCKAVHDTALRSGRDDLAVPLEECEDAIRDAVGAVPDDKIDTRERLWRNVLKPIPDSMLSEDERDGELWLSVGDETISRIQDVGDDESSGGALHSLVLRDAYPAFNGLGVDVEIAQQGEGNRSLPDGLIDPTPLLEIGPDADPVEIADALETFREEHPTVDALTGGREAVLEAEKSTGSTKQGQTVRNLASAVNDGKRCLFVCREDVADNVWKTLAEEPRGARERHSIEGETRFYNLRPLGIDGQRAYRDGSREDVWVRDEETGEIVLRDGSGTEHARFPDAEAVFEDADRYDVVGKEAAEDDDRELRTVKTPIIPEYEFGDGDVPEPGEDWFIVTVPSTAEDETLSVDDLEIYIDGMTVPIESLGTDDQDDEPTEEPEPEPEPETEPAETKDDGGLFTRF